MAVSACENPVNAGVSRPHGCIHFALSESPSSTPTAASSPSSPSAPRRPAGICSQSTGAVPPRDLVAMKLNALLVDPAVLGDEAWAYLERVASMLPDLGLVVCTGRSTVAQRVRGLRLGVDDWMTKPCHPEEAIARIEAVSRRRRRGRQEHEAAPLAAGELEIRPDRFQAFVGDERPRPHPPRVRAALPARRGARPGARARADLPAGLGLRDGPRRPLGRRLRPQAAPEAGEASRRAGPTSTPTSASATASTPNRPGIVAEEIRAPGAGAGRPRPSRSRAGFTNRSQQLHGRITAAGLARSAPCVGDAWDGWRSSLRSTRRWSTGGR